jgi:hypothetical protein
MLADARIIRDGGGMSQGVPGRCAPVSMPGQNGRGILARTDGPRETYR